MPNYRGRRRSPQPPGRSEPEDVAESIPCGPDVDAVLDAVGRFSAAGFTHLALVQVGGGHQGPFLEWVADGLLGATRPGRLIRPPVAAHPGE